MNIVASDMPGKKQSLNIKIIAQQIVFKPAIGYLVLYHLSIASDVSSWALVFMWSFVYVFQSAILPPAVFLIIIL